MFVYRRLSAGTKRIKRNNDRSEKCRFKWCESSLIYSELVSIVFYLVLILWHAWNHCYLIECTKKNSLCSLFLCSEFMKISEIYRKITAVWCSAYVLEESLVFEGGNIYRWLLCILIFHVLSHVQCQGLKNQHTQQTQRISTGRIQFEIDMMRWKELCKNDLRSHPNYFIPVEYGKLQTWPNAFKRPWFHKKIHFVYFAKTFKQ